MSDFAQPTDRGAGQNVSDEVVATRSQEDLRIATHARETGRARLTKYLETDTVTKTIPLRREQVRIEYAPISAADERRPPDSTPAADADAWLVLYEEEIVVQTRWVPRERVRLVTHTVTETQKIREKVREERVALVADGQAGVTPAAVLETKTKATDPGSPTADNKPIQTEDK